jgi:hypothetical protein
MSKPGRKSRAGWWLVAIAASATVLILAGLGSKRGTPPEMGHLATHTQLPVPAPAPSILSHVVLMMAAGLILTAAVPIVVVVVASRGMSRPVAKPRQRQAIPARKLRELPAPAPPMPAQASGSRESFAMVRADAPAAAFQAAADGELTSLNGNQQNGEGPKKCEGPDCARNLPANPWKIGVSVGAPDDDGMCAVVYHDFCGQACSEGWIEQDKLQQAALAAGSKKGWR